MEKQKQNKPINQEIDSQNQKNRTHTLNKVYVFTARLNFDIKQINKKQQLERRPDLTKTN